MLASPARNTSPSPVLRRPIPGVTVVRFAGERPLMRAVPEHYGTTTQLAGRSHWTSGGVQWSSAPGSLGIKVPGQVVVERAREGQLDFHAVVFDTALVDEAFATLGRPPRDPLPLPLPPGDPRARPLLALHRHLLADEPAHVLAQATCAALHSLVDLVGASRGRTPERRATYSAAVLRARRLLDERFTETVDLEALATHARLDKFRLCRAFSEQVGIPPHAYVTHRRVALAADLLARGVPQAEVATRVGFYDQSLLHRHFKRIIRLTPGEFVRGH